MQPSNTINVQPNKMSQLLVLPQLSMPSPLHQQYRFQSIVDNNVSSSTAVNSYRTSLHNEARTEETESGFQPGPFDVICSQGKTAKAHPGNIHFHKVIQKWAKEYSAATEKKVKSKIVRNIIETIQAKSPNGGFVKKDSDGQWKMVGFEQAREKVSQSLRDTLAGRYRSSLSAKKKSRMESNLKRMIDFDEIVGSNKFVADKMIGLANTIKKTNSGNTDDFTDPQILQKMTETNFCILRQLKKDQMVQKSVRGRTPSPPRYSALDQTIQQFAFDRQFMMP